ncbi:MAG TPA: asparagine synthase-related protein [Bryobacteraceae bacterium]
MSGIAAVLDFGGTDCRAAVERLTLANAAFGPDRHKVWSGGRVALGHAMLETVPESADEVQPLTFDNRCWITADARLDGRADLIGKLRGFARLDLDPLPDSALILQAYLVWGKRSVEFLLGDFAFVIWDAPRQTLFCARDHFGLKPLFYARTAKRILFSSSQAALRNEVDTDAVDELAIADFLLFAYKQDQSATSYRAIRKLPPAHTARIGLDGNVKVCPYWELPIEEPVRYKRAEDYVENFRELFSVAVRDRLRTPVGLPPAVLLSGGLDSCAIAASAVAHSATSVAAFTFTFDNLVRHEEPHYSRLAAGHLGIPQVMMAAGDQPAFHRFDEPGFLPGEPLNEPFLAATQSGYRRISATSRVVLTGNCGDEVLQNSAEYPAYALRHGRRWELLRDTAGFVRRHRRLPRLGVRTAIRRKTGIGVSPGYQPEFPSWLKPEYVARLDLAARWREIFSRPHLHPSHPEAHDALSAIPWRHGMEEFAPDLTGAPLEFRHPFLDLRLVQYALRLPAFPYCVGKQVLRSAFEKVLPPAILERPKTLMTDDPLCASLRRWGVPRPSPATAAIVDREKLEKSLQTLSPANAWVDIRPLVLDYFLLSTSMDKGRKTA